MANYIVKEHNGSDGADSRTKSTIAVWVKRCRTGTEEGIWSWGENNSSDAYLKFMSDDKLNFHSDGTGSPFSSVRLFRDTSAWYHLVVALDCNNGTEALRRRIWINGVEWVHGNSNTSTTAAVMGHNSVQDLYIGDIARRQQNSSNGRPFSGYMSHFHYCDGYAYTASDFGQFDSTSGEWCAKTAPAVNYGTHGIFLKMEDTSNLALDSSPNNSSQMSIGGVLYPTQDCPNNNFNTYESGQYPYESATSSLDLGNLKTNYGSGWSQIYSNLGSSKGKFYWEVKKITGTYIKAGFLTEKGAAIPSESNYHIADHIYGWAAYISGNDFEIRTNAGVISGYDHASLGSNTFADNDILCLALDLDNHRFHFRKNDGSWLKSGDPAGNSGGLAFTLSDSIGWYCIPGISHHSSTACTNFGNGYFGTTAVASAGTNASNNGIFEFDVPTGFTAWSTKGLNL